MVRAIVKPVAAALALALPFSAPSAGAASPSETRGNMWITLATPCQTAGNDPGKTPAEQLELCQQMLAALQQRHADPANAPQDDLEENFYWLAITGIRAEVAGAMIAIDKGRSRRACEQILFQAGEYAKFKPEAWPENYRQPIREMVQAFASPVAKCRAEWG